MKNKKLLLIIFGIFLASIALGCLYFHLLSNSTLENLVSSDEYTNDIKVSSAGGLDNENVVKYKVPVSNKEEQEQEKYINQMMIENDQIDSLDNESLEEHKTSAANKKEQEQKVYIDQVIVENDQDEQVASQIKAIRVSAGKYEDEDYGFSIILPDLFDEYTVEKEGNVISFITDLQNSDWGETFRAFVIVIYDIEWWNEHVDFDEYNYPFYKQYPDDPRIGHYLGSDEEFYYVMKKGHDCPDPYDDGPHCKLYFISTSDIADSFQVAD